MTRYVGLLYSITLAQGKRVLNAPLGALLEGLGYGGVRTLLATGNVVFDAPGDAPRAIEADVEPAFAKAFGRQIDFIVRSGSDWERLAAVNPFPGQSQADPSHVIVRVMREPITPDAARLLAERAGPAEIVRIVGGDPWFFFGAGVAGSKLTGVMKPGRIGPGTARNWNTVEKIAAAL